MDTNHPANHRGPMPVAFFGIAVGSLALAGAWRAAARVWTIPHALPTLLTAGALAVWLALLAAYAMKWLTQRDDARAELAHPIQSSFTALVPVSTMLAAQAVQTYSRELAIALFAVGVASQLALGAYLHGRLWQGGRKPEMTTPAMYLPSVAPSFVAGTAAAGFGWTQLGAVFFGAGVFSWLAIESMVLSRAAVHDALPEALRPTLGIQLAPPAVGAVCYLAVKDGPPDLLAQALIGYALLQALLLLRLGRWIAEQPFGPSYWAFTFGATALAAAAIKVAAATGAGALAILAPVLFAAANGLVLVIAAGTVWLAICGRLLPAPSPPPG
jgi:tellurite resistance protein